MTATSRTSSWRDEWWFRYGWNRPGDAPPALEGPAVSIRKVEIHDVYDLKRWWWKGTDGIRETTWPGVYNRSRLPGRNDYFQLPDWDAYSTSGKVVTFLMPDEPWNQLEVSGAAFGTLEQVAGRDAKTATPLFERPKGQERTFHRLAAPVTGQAVRFTNVEQETPIGEFGAYYVTPAREPSGTGRLTYRLTGLAQLDQPNTRGVREFIEGRFAPDERTTMVALPAGAPRRSLAARTPGLPIVHIVIPGDLRDEVTSAVRGVPGQARAIDYRPYAYGWMNMQGGLAGIAIDLPALDVKPTHGEYFPLNIQVKDPIWPLRNMLDVSVSVKPGVAHTVYLDTRDRVLRADKPLYLTIAGAGADFGAASLEGAEVRLIFTSRDTAAIEQSLDRFTQARDLFAHTVEERPNSRRLSLYTRFETDLTDLFAVDPGHQLGREYLVRGQPRAGAPGADVEHASRRRSSLGLPPGRVAARDEALRELLHRPPANRERRVRWRTVGRWRPDELVAGDGVHRRDAGEDHGVAAQARWRRSTTRACSRTACRPSRPTSCTATKKASRCSAR